MFDFLLQILLHADRSLATWISLYGVWAIGIVAVIVFCETGLVVMPFLPGDSLLFVTGAAIAGTDIPLHTAVLVLIAAAIAGDAVNFAVGSRVGRRVEVAAAVRPRRGIGRFIRTEHLERTRGYFERFGGMTVIVARFVPIVRTFAPFMAGAGAMAYPRFLAFNVIGGVAWVCLFVYAGALFGNLPIVRDHLGLMTLGIVVLSVLPMVWTFLQARRPARA